MTLDPHALDQALDAALMPETWHPHWDTADFADATVYRADGTETTLGALRSTDEALAAEAGAAYTEAREAWQIDGERTAEWAMRRVRQAVADRDRAKALADVLRAEAAAYEAKVTAETEHTVAFFSGKLRHYHQGILDERPRATTIHHPSGDLARRAGSLSLVVVDEKLAVAAIEDTKHADAVLDYPDPKVRKDPAKAAFGAKAGTDPGYYPAVDENGVIIPGLKVKRSMPSETLSFVDGSKLKLATPDLPDEDDDSEGNPGELEGDLEAGELEPVDTDA